VNNRIRPILFKILKFAIIGAIFYFVINNVVSNWEQLAAQGVHFDPLYALLSILVMMLAWLTTSWSWGKTLEAFGAKLKYRDVFVIYFRSMIGKYLPGKFWQIVGSTYLASKRGVQEGPTIASVVVGQVYSLFSGLVIFMSAIAIWGMNFSSGSIFNFKLPSICVLVLILILSLNPNLTKPAMNWFLRLFKRTEIDVEIDIRQSLRLFILFLIPWFAFGFSFWLFARSLTFVPFGQYLKLTSIMVGATVIGFLAIFSPGGLGIREGMIVILMTSMTEYSVSFSSAVAVGYRFLSLIVEMVAFCLTWAINGKRNTIHG